MLKFIRSTRSAHRHHSIYSSHLFIPFENISLNHFKTFQNYSKHFKNLKLKIQTSLKFKCFFHHNQNWKRTKCQKRTKTTKITIPYHTTPLHKNKIQTYKIFKRFFCKTVNRKPSRKRSKCWQNVVVVDNSNCKKLFKTFKLLFITNVKIKKKKNSCTQKQFVFYPRSWPIFSRLNLDNKTKKQRSILNNLTNILFFGCKIENWKSYDFVVSIFFCHFVHSKTEHDFKKIDFIIFKNYKIQVYPQILNMAQQGTVKFFNPQKGWSKF